jgi:catechol 2,3-dioxygenase-like lactoylglutathione lyase family enzyme
MKRATLPARARRAPAAPRRYRGRPATRGVHHLALTTEDMKMCVDFYTQVLGMPLVHAMKVPPGIGVGPGNRGNPPYESLRHYFFDMGNDSLLAFFEIPKDAEPKAKRDAIGGMQHVAFTVTPAQFRALQGRLQAAKVPFDGPIDILPGLVSIYFYDPNGIRLEACCQPRAGTRPRVIGSVLQTRAGARRELDTLERIDAAWLEEAVRELPGER